MERIDYSDRLKSFVNVEIDTIYEKIQPILRKHKISHKARDEINEVLNNGKK
jgi:hypothetical protein